MRDNPVAVPRLVALAGKARSTGLTPAETEELLGLQGQALRQGRAVGAVLGLFLKFKPYPMLEEVRKREPLFQPAFGPVLVVDGNLVREVFERDQEFTVEPYGVEMTKVMSPQHNGGFSTFVLSTDDSDRLRARQTVALARVQPRRRRPHRGSASIEECVRRVGVAVAAARANWQSDAGALTIDVVDSVARYVPVALGHKYLGVPVAPQTGIVRADAGDADLLRLADRWPGRDRTRKHDGVIPDERQMYVWIKAAFRHFFNNVQKDPVVQVEGLRACRQLLAYLLREVDIQRQRILAGQPVDDTMLTRLVHFQLGSFAPTVERPRTSIRAWSATFASPRT